MGKRERVRDKGERAEERVRDKGERAEGRVRKGERGRKREGWRKGGKRDRMREKGEKAEGRARKGGRERKKGRWKKMVGGKGGGRWMKTNVCVCKCSKHVSIFYLKM